jgi:hypothetical protein
MLRVALAAQAAGQAIAAGDDGFGRTCRDDLLHT